MISPTTCYFCKKAFSSKWGLTSHMFTHTGGRPQPHECYVCDRPFSMKGDLRRHMRKHTGERPFPCSHFNSVQKKIGVGDKHDRN